jgi:hypothetical protein
MFKGILVGIISVFSNIRTKFIFGAAGFGAAVSGLILAFFEVQGWNMPTPLAIAVFAILFLMLVVAVGAIIYEIVRSIRKYLEEHATSSSWVSKEEPGLLDFEADGTRATERFTKEITKLKTNTEKLAKKLTKYTSEFTDWNKSGKVIAGTEKQKKANNVAKDIDRNAIYIANRTELFNALIHDIARNYNGAISNAPIQTEEDKKNIRSLSDSLVFYEQATFGAINSVGRYRNAVREIEKQNISRTIRIASARLGNGLDRLLETFQDSHQNSSSMRVKIDKRLSANQ